MNKLWAPWRINYVTKKKDDKKSKCIFCKILRQKSDKKNYIILRSKHCFAVLNTFPYNNGHTMIVTNRHIKELEQLKDGEIVDVNRTLVKVKAVLKSTLKPQGFNIGVNLGKIAGAGIDQHLHIHIVPRWMGDTNFMPVLTNTKIISQSLGELYDNFRKIYLKSKRKAN